MNVERVFTMAIGLLVGVMAGGLAAPYWYWIDTGIVALMALVTVVDFLFGND